MLLYGAAFFSNMGNYKSFGDTKFVPALSQGAATVDAILAATHALRDASANAGRTLADLWAAVREPMFSLTPRERQLALGADQGVSTYFSYNCTDADAQLAQRFLTAHGARPRSAPPAPPPHPPHPLHSCPARPGPARPAHMNACRPRGVGGQT